MRPHLIVQLVCHRRFGSSGPFSTFSEVLLDQRPVGAVLKEAGPPSHRSLNDLISHNEKDVSGHGSIHACKKSTSPLERMFFKAARFQLLNIHIIYIISILILKCMWGKLLFCLLTCWCEIWSFVLQGPVDGFWPPHIDALMMQNIAHFFNFSNSFFQVVRRKRLAPVLLVEGPILLICISLWGG